MNDNGRPESRLFTKLDKIVFGILGLISLLSIVFWKTIKSEKNKKAGTEFVKKESKNKNDSTGKKKVNAKIDSEVSIVEKWDMPDELKEVSGISYLDNQRFACIQDESGVVFIFNSASNKIEKKVSFAQKGDFEGIAVKGDLAYVVRADGKLFEVNMTKAGKTSAKEYETSLTAKQNIESLCYDKDNNRLLLCVKDDEPNRPGYKGIYAFDLAKKYFIDEPVFKIDLNNDIIQKSQKKNVMPSAIGLHPDTGEIFITDGPQSKLLIMDKDGNIKQFLELGKDFSQPEGITFSPDGEIFISNEGTKLPGNILKIEI